MTIFVSTAYPHRLRVRKRYPSFRCRRNPHLLHATIVGVWVCGCGASDHLGRQHEHPQD